MRIFIFFSHLDPVDTGDHFSELADCEGEEEGDGEAEDVEHGETQEGSFCSHYLECFSSQYSYQSEDSLAWYLSYLPSETVDKKGTEQDEA